MATQTLQDPFAVAPPAEQRPQPARLEIIERHGGAKYGPDALLCPNGLRINGVSLWCPVEAPIVVEEIRVSGERDTPLVVTLRLLARALRVGEEPERFDPAAASEKRRFATVELPHAEDGVARYAIVDGHRLLLDKGVIVDQIDVGAVVAPVYADRRALIVTLSLVCRSVVFDDEPTGTPA